MKTEFSLEFYYEQDVDPRFVEVEAEKLRTLVHRLAPHIELRTKVYKAKNISTYPFCRDGKLYYIPEHEHTEEGSQTLVVTNNDIGSQGRSGPGKGCVCKPRMEQKIRAGGDSAEITIHEWLHTIEGKDINGRIIPSPDDKTDPRFVESTVRGPDGDIQWLDWYKYLLRAE